jgi:tripartite motif-containing protein 71
LAVAVAVVGVGTMTTPVAAASQMMSYVQMVGLPRLTTPEGVAVDPSGNVFVVDSATPGVSAGDRVAEFSADGTFLDVMAGPGSAAGQVLDPTSIAISPTTGDIFVLQSGNNSIPRVQRFDPLGNYIAAGWPTTSTYGTGNGQYHVPQGIAVDSAGNVWVADTNNKRIQEFTPNGIWQGTLDLTLAPCTTPNEVAFDSADVLYVVGSGKVCRYDTSLSLLNSWTSTGATAVDIDAADNAWVTGTANVIKVYDATGATVATYGAAGAGDGQLTSPQALAIAPSGKTYVADTGNGRVERFSSVGVFQTEWGHFPDAGVLDSPKGIAVDASDNVYVTNQQQGIIQKFDKDGTLLAESTYGAGNANGQLSSSNLASTIAVDPSTGNLFVTDTNNYRIQEFSPSLTYITQWGSFGSIDGQFNKPQGIAVDASGNVFVADTLNNRIQEFDSSHAWVRTWGSSAPSTGSATGAFNKPKGIAIDTSGNVWVADSGNNRIQGFGSTGVFIQAWGSSGTGDGNLSGPSDIDVQPGGAILVDDFGHDRVQRFTPGGTYLDQLGSTGLDLYQFDAPNAIAVDSNGRLLVADTTNDRVQVFADLNGPDTTITGGPGSRSNLSTATFQFTANDVGVTFKCKMDAGSYASCANGVGYSSLPDGDHTFSVYATDSLDIAGNPTTYPWTIDTVPPGVSITSTPALVSKSTSPSFDFDADEAVTNYFCQLDASASAACSSPRSFTGVSDGSHTFQVWAFDLAGNQSAVASYAWTVDTSPPSVTIDTGPSGRRLVDTATFTFHSDTDPSATFQCQLDSGGFGACSSGVSYGGLTPGQHTFEVEATDAIGNVSAPASRSWTVDPATHRPDGLITKGTSTLGDGIYNNTGTNQTKTAKVKVGSSVKFKITLQNDGDDTDTYKVVGPKSGGGYTVTYLDGTTNVTSQVTGGSYSALLDPDASKVLTLKVTVGSSAGTSKSVSITVTSTHDTSKVDVVKAVVKRA